MIRIDLTRFLLSLALLGKLIMLAVHTRTRELGDWLAGENGALCIKWAPMGGLAILSLLPLFGTVVIWQRPQRGMA